MMDSGGTAWANNKNGGIFAFQPTYQELNPTVKSEDIKTQTFYRAGGTLKVAQNVVVPAGTDGSPMNVLFEGKQGISFAAGFTVKRGASLLCRTGF